MSSGVEFKATRQDLEEMVRIVAERAWEESKRWPNHTLVSVSVRWELDSNGSAVPRVTLTGKP